MKSLIVFCVSVVACANFAIAGELVTGDAAIAKFPASLQAMGLHTAKWMQLTNGVEYYYGRFTNMLGNLSGFTGSKNDLHMLRIDYKKAPVKMKFVDHTQTSTKKWTTSKTAAQYNALFAINMTMEDANGGPQGYVKVDGVEVPSLQSTAPDGFAFNNDKAYKFDRKWLDVDPETGNPKADAWANVVSHEAYTVHNGVPTWDGTANFSRANYTFFGTTADGILWACVVDGRRSASEGLGYHEVGALQFELGCVEGVCCDGGGSSTMAIRKDLMTVSDICDTQKTSKYSSDYYTMNYLSGRQAYGITIGAGSEREVINQLLFVEAPVVEELEPFELGEPASRPSTNYNGNVVSITFTGDIPVGAAVTAQLTLNGIDYLCVGTIDVESGIVTFSLGDNIVTAGNTYTGTVTVRIGSDVYNKSVTLAQGTFKVDENSGWVKESASTFSETGTWSGDRAEVTGGKISVSNAMFTASNAAPKDAVVTISSVQCFNDAAEEDFGSDCRAAVKVVNVGGVNRYAVQTATGAVTNLNVVANVSGNSCVTFILSNAMHTVSYSVDGVPIGTYPMIEKATGVSAIRYIGETEVTSLDGAYRFEGLDSNLAKAGGAEYATVADAVAAGKNDIELLWDTTWDPESAGNYTINTNGHVLAIGGALAYSVKDNGNGTITVTVAGGASPDAPAAMSITFAGSTAKVGVSEAQANCWYALEKTTDLALPFVVDQSTWVSGSSLIAGSAELAIAMDGSESQAFYRIVVSATKPAALP